MFIKILTPNHNGKIELTVRDLEALIQEAVDKATKEKCTGCSRGYYCGTTYPFTTTTPGLTLCNSTADCVDIADLNSIHTTEAKSNISGSVNTLMSKINETCN